MSEARDRPDVEMALAGLKDFQRASVDYVFKRIYEDPDPARRFLIADEVGLGKTLVARGLIARTIDHLWDDVERIDIVYVCSNLDIATQNIDRLRLPGCEPYRFASRLTLLPVNMTRLDPKLNLVSFTPGTSFEFNRSSLGSGAERRVLYRLLEDVWNFRGEAPMNVLRGEQYKVNFRDWLKWERKVSPVDEDLADSFAQALESEARDATAEGEPSLRERFDDLCERFARDRKRAPWNDRDDRGRLVNDLRNMLAHTCVAALEPDLIILDEFQRFKHLLDPRLEVGEFAHELFNWGDARVALLSATPYKMYTINEEAGEEDHYADFLETMRFLLGGDAAAVDELREHLSEYRHLLLSLGDGDMSALLRARDEIQGRLRKVMVRTERLAATADRSGMLKQVPPSGMTLEIQDVREYVAVQRVTRALADHSRVGQRDSLEYWKSAPYLLNFMDADGYKLKQAFAAVCERDGAACEAGAKGDECRREVAGELARQRRALLDWADVQAYEALDPGNARLRYVLGNALAGDAWRLLWLPPSLPYYRPGGPFADPALGSFTKQLVFSSWAVVPKAVATLVSYEAERRAQLSADAEAQNTPEARAKLTGPLRFARGPGDSLTGMNVLPLIYPSVALARHVDPMQMATRLSSGKAPSLSSVAKEAEARVGELLERLSDRLPLQVGESRGRDDRWYWAAPLLLDLAEDPEGTKAWLEQTDLAAQWAGEEYRGDASTGAWADHLREARALVLADEIVMGPWPKRLPRVLAEVGLAAPGVAALRAVGRVMGGGAAELGTAERRLAAARIAWSLRNLFNSPESIAIIRGLDGQARRKTRDDAFWRRVLDYCASGCLQAVLDEYAHVVWDTRSLTSKGPEEALEALRATVCEALGLRAAVLGLDHIEVDAETCVMTSTSQRMRSRYAMQFGNQQREDETRAERAGAIREAFNSPFWPFVLTTTSVGQGGLDFHLYCHAVVHWNLPANPVDLEQREGRVHRYKGHAVRKNVASACGDDVLAAGVAGDPWQALFDCAKARRTGKDGDDTELVPYWVYGGPASIQRHAPVLPLSRDAQHLEALVKSLGIYRVLIGQPRQDELLAWLSSRDASAEGEEFRPEDLVMDLGPAARCKPDAS